MIFSKRLIARKVKDGYLVEITKVKQAESKLDVARIIKEEGVKLKPQFSNKDRIYAEYEEK